MAAALTPKQELFVSEYLVDLNATQAAIRAGYTKRSARVQASRLLTNAAIQASIASAFANRIERLELTQDSVVKQLMAIAFSDIRDVVSWGDAGEIEMVPSDELTRDAAAALREVRSTTSTVIFHDGQERSTVYKAVKQHDKMRALELLGKHLGMFVDRVEHSGNVGLTLTKLVELANRPPAE